MRPPHKHPLTRLIRDYGHTIKNLTNDKVLENFTDEEHYNRDEDYLWKILIFTVWSPIIANPYLINNKVYFVHDKIQHHIDDTQHHWETWLHGIDTHEVDYGANGGGTGGGSDGLGDDNQLTVYDKTITSYKQCKLQYKQVAPKDTDKHFTVLKNFTFTSMVTPLVSDNHAPIYDNIISYLCIVQHADYYATGLILRYKHRFFKVKKIIDHNNDHVLMYLYLEALGESTGLKGVV